MKISAFLFLTFLSSQVWALSGFNCVSVDRDLVVQIVFGQGQSALRWNSAAMVVSNPHVKKGRQFVARFRSSQGMLEREGSTFIGHVLPQHPDSSRVGERIAGTTLGQLRTISVDIDFTPARAALPTTPLSAQVTYMKRNGQKLAQDFDCWYRAL